MLTTLEQEYLNLIGRATELPRVTYAGGQAGTGTGGVNGAGPIGINATSGHVRTGNVSGTQTLEDGSTIVTTIRADGSKNIIRADYSTGFIYEYNFIPGVMEEYKTSYLNGNLKLSYKIKYVNGYKKNNRRFRYENNL
jgi:hypothetical protein